MQHKILEVCLIPFRISYNSCVIVIENRRDNSNSMNSLTSRVYSGSNTLGMLR